MHADRNELLKKVRKIAIKSRGLSNHIFSGEYHSAFKGKGMSFREVREYAFGDETKFIDWNVTARLNAPYLKLFEEERELTVMLLVDVSQSAFFGTHGQMKNELITEICAVLAFSVINNNDKVGALFFSDKIQRFIPPKKGRSHVLRIIHELLTFATPAPTAANETRPSPPTTKNRPPWQNLWPIGAWWRSSRKQPQTAEFQLPNNSENQTNIASALQYFSNVIKKRCIAFLLSDFIADNYEKPLNLAARKHDVVGIHVYDLREQDLPPVGLVQVEDAETGQLVWLDTNDANLRRTYKLRFGKHVEQCKTAFSKAGADLISIPTHKPYIPFLANFFKKRGGT